MSRIVLTLCVFSCTLWGNYVSAQDYVDILTVNYVMAPKNTFEGSGGETSIQEIFADLTIPIPLGDKSVLITGSTYEESKMKFSNGGPDMNFGFFLAKLGWIQTINDKLSLQVVTIPKWATTFSALNQDAFQFGVLGQANVNASNGWVWKFALYGNSEFFGPFLTPFVGVFFRKNDFRVDLFIPAKGDIGYYVTPSTRVGLLFRGKLGTMQMPQPFSFENEYLHRVNNELSLYTDIQLGKVALFATGGATIGRYYRIYESSDKIDFALNMVRFGDDRVPLNEELKDALFFKLGTRIRFDIK